MGIRIVLQSVIFTLAGCIGGPGGPGGPAGQGGLCANPLVEVTPETGASPVVMTSDFGLNRQQFDSVSLTWETSPALPMIRVETVETEEEIQGRSTSEDGVWYWWPSGALPLNTELQVSVEVAPNCGYEEVTRFTTGSFGGTPSVDCLEGAVYELDFSDAEIKPASMAMLADVMWVQAYDVAETVSARLVTLDEGEQDMCVETQDIEGADYSSSPFFSLSERDILTYANGQEFEVTDFTASGMFSGDCEEVGYGTIHGKVDLSLFSYGGDMSIEEMCALMAGVGADCVPCENGLKQCVVFDGEGVAAHRVDATVEKVTASQADECDA